MPIIANIDMVSLLFKIMYKQIFISLSSTLMFKYLEELLCNKIKCQICVIITILTQCKLEQIMHLDKTSMNFA